LPTVAAPAKLLREQQRIGVRPQILVEQRHSAGRVGVGGLPWRIPVAVMIDGPRAQPAATPASALPPDARERRPGAGVGQAMPASPPRSALALTVGLLILIAGLLAPAAGSAAPIRALRVARPRMRVLQAWAEGARRASGWW
jgi:hypothetical protein